MHNGHLHGKASSIFADSIRLDQEKSAHLWLVGCKRFKVSFCSTATCCIGNVLKLEKLVKSSMADITVAPTSSSRCNTSCTFCTSTSNSPSTYTPLFTSSRICVDADQQLSRDFLKKNDIKHHIICICNCSKRSHVRYAGCIELLFYSDKQKIWLVWLDEVQRTNTINTHA